MNTHLEEARARMIAQQVRAWSVLDPVVLETLRSVPRERFVPERYAAVAFADAPIPLGHGQWMMTPQVEGRLLQALEIDRGDRVLEIGTGSGFLTACLGRLAASVDSLELFPDLAEAARARLAQAGAGNCRVLEQDVFSYRPDRQWDVIAVTGALPQPDPRLASWLAPGGRMFVIIGEEPVMEACLVRRTAGDEWTTDTLFETLIPPLCNAQRPPQFRL